MTLQEFLVRSTQRALDDVCRAALAVPEERRSWSPGGEARSVLSQMKEVAMTGAWFVSLITQGGVDGDRHQDTSPNLETVEQCIELARDGVGQLCSAIATFPDSDLDREVLLPFGGGTVMAMADVLALAQWNFTYHLGQINQIQLLLGDPVMH